MQAELYWIDDTRRNLAIMPRPRAGDWLSEEVASWRLAGLALKWVWEYRAGKSWMGTDLIEAAAIVVIAAALAQPLVLLILLYARLCAVAMSASVGRAAARISGRVTNWRSSGPSG